MFSCVRCSQGLGSDKSWVSPTRTTHRTKQLCGKRSPGMRGLSSCRRTSTGSGSCSVKAKCLPRPPSSWRQNEYRSPKCPGRCRSYGESPFKQHMDSISVSICLCFYLYFAEVALRNFVTVALKRWVLVTLRNLVHLSAGICLAFNDLPDLFSFILQRTPPGWFSHVSLCALYL